jgi:hypothetical protein
MPPIDSRVLRGNATPVALVAAVVLLAAPAHAQVNIESLRIADADAGLSGTLGGNLAVQTGNTDFVQLGVDGRANWVRGASTTLLIGSGGLGFLAGSRFSSSALLHLRETRWLNDRVAAEGYGQINYDRPQLLDFRALAGAGARIRVASGAWGGLGAGVSFMIEEERLDLPPSAIHPERTSTWRNSTFVTLRLLGGEALAVSSTAYLQPSLADGLDDIRVIENLSVGASLTDRLALTITFDLRYDSQPPDGIADLDTRLRTGLSFSY